MDEASRPISVAILINDTAQRSLALRMAKAFAETGTAVVLFFLGQTSMPVGDSTPAGPCFECYSDSIQTGMDCLPLSEIARRLKQCDLVIPI